MRYDPTLHHRRSIRLQGYDYAQAGAYFVTICTQGRECLFGEIVDGQMRLNEAGKMAWNTWHEMPKHYPRVQIDAFMVMPNHIHGIVILVGQAQAAVECPNTVCVGAAPCGRPETIGQARGLGQAQGPDPTDFLALPDVVRQYKTLTMKRYADGVRQCGWRPFLGKLWQRNYWERVIRDEQEVQAVREYIQNNPARWAEDQLNAPTPFV